MVAGRPNRVSPPVQTINLSRHFDPDTSVVNVFGPLINSFTENAQDESGKEGTDAAIFVAMVMPINDQHQLRKQQHVNQIRTQQPAKNENTLVRYDYEQIWNVTVPWAIIGHQVILHEQLKFEWISLKF